MNQPLFSYITIAFIAPVVFLCCINDRDRYSYGLIFFHGRSIFWKTLLFSLPRLLDFLTFVPILSTGDCNVDISEQLIYQVNDLVLFRISRLFDMPKFLLCTS